MDMEEMFRALREWNSRVAALRPMEADTLEPGHTLLVVIDMINGFAREGALASPRVEGIIPAVAGLSRRCAELRIPRIALSDCHTPSSAEFASYPPHCLEGTREAELVEELKAVVLESMEKSQRSNGRDWSAVKGDVKNDLSNYLFKKTKRNPMILPVIMEV